MASPGTSNRVQLAFIKESTPGTTPTNPALQILRFTSETLNENNVTLRSEEITSGRDVPDLILSDQDNSGNISGEFSATTFDAFIAAVLFADSDWSTNAITEQTTIAATVDGFTDSGSGFVSAGFQQGQFIKVAGFTPSSINGIYRILTVAAGAITTYPAPPTTDSAGDEVTITGSTIENGVTNHSFTIQKAFLDLAVPAYKNFRGCRFSNMSLQLSAGQRALIEFGIMGMTSEVTTSNISGATYTPKTTTPIMNCVVNASNLIAISGSMTTLVRFTDLQLSWDNALRQLKAIGTFGAFDIKPGTIDAQATLNPYFEDIQMLTAFLANNSFHLSWRLTDAAGVSYVFSLPNVKFTAQSGAEASGRDQDLILNTTVQALLDPTQLLTMRVDKLS